MNKSLHISGARCDLVALKLEADKCGISLLDYIYLVLATHVRKISNRESLEKLEDIE